MYLTSDPCFHPDRKGRKGHNDRYAVEDYPRCGHGDLYLKFKRQKNHEPLNTDKKLQLRSTEMHFPIKHQMMESWGRGYSWVSLKHVRSFICIFIPKLLDLTQLGGKGWLRALKVTRGQDPYRKNIHCIKALNTKSTAINFPNCHKRVGTNLCRIKSSVSKLNVHFNCINVSFSYTVWFLMSICRYTLPFKSLGSLRNVFIFQIKALFFQ